ncbi:MAG: phytanoyl-CoA dioxygenase family protein, partial [Actinomycetota bacterium]|nr:phytanoyl-CoA dioxygenase family protein [Actinomycetota bacterium]
VQQLTDSTSLASDGPALRARLAEDGYLFFRGLLPREGVLQVRAGVYAALDAAGWLAEGSTLDAPLPTPLAVREGGEGYLAAYLGIQREQAFHELAHSADLVPLLSLMIGEQLLVHPRKIARTSLPKDDEYTPPHQDFRLIQGSVDTFTVWVPLGDCPASLGSLRMLAGSHKQGLIEADSGKGPGGLKVDVGDDHPDWRTTDYQAGDVIVFTSLTVHGALPNTEDCLRFSADFRYQPLRDPVLAESLQPHYFPDVPGWDVLTEGWTSTHAVLAPDDAVLAGMLSPLDPALRAPASRLLAAG